MADGSDSMKPSGTDQPSVGKPLARVDGAHQPAAHITPAGQPEPPAVCNLVPAAAGQSLDALPAQLHQQASELEVQLQGRHCELARWEASLHARMARWEDEQRGQRIWWREQDAALADRENELEKRAAQIADREAELEVAGQTTAQLRCRRDELDAREEALDARQRQLAEQQERVAQQDAWLSAAQRQLETSLAECSATHAKMGDAPADEPVDPDSLPLAAGDNVDSRLQALCRLEQLVRARMEMIVETQADLQRQLRDGRDRTRRQRQQLARIWQRRRSALRLQFQQVQQQRETLQRHRHRVDQLTRQLAGQSPGAWSQDVGAVTPAASVTSTAPMVQLVEHLADKRQALTRVHQQLRRESTAQSAQLQQQHRDLEDTIDAIAAAEIRLAEARRDWTVHWQRETHRLDELLAILRRTTEQPNE